MTDWVNRELTRAHERASKAGEARLAAQPRAVRAHYDARKAWLVVELANGVILMLPPVLLQDLKAATAAQLARVELTPFGTGLHWEELDADAAAQVLITDQQ
jgi:Protein of unknown function (DUF2442)